MGVRLSGRPSAGLRGNQNEQREGPPSEAADSPRPDGDSRGGGRRKESHGLTESELSDAPPSVNYRVDMINGRQVLTPWTPHFSSWREAAQSFVPKDLRAIDYVKGLGVPMS